MGAEFKRKQAAAFKKAMDSGLVALGTPDLFTQIPTRAPRVIAAEIIGAHLVKPGACFVIQKKGKSLVALDGLTEIATVPTPPMEVVQFVDESFGVAKGIVETVHDEAAILEISIC